MSRLEQLLALTAKSKKPLAWYGLAMEYRGLGDVENAIATFKRVHDIDENYVAAYFMCAQVYAELGRTADARAELDRGLVAAAKVSDDHAAAEMRALRDELDDG
jgi:tetratricopeptide (TPR) repeat protein